MKLWSLFQFVSFYVVEFSYASETGLFFDNLRNVISGVGQGNATQSQVM